MSDTDSRAVFGTEKFISKADQVTPAIVEIIKYSQQEKVACLCGLSEYNAAIGARATMAPGKWTRLSKWLDEEFRMTRERCINL